MWKGHRPTLWTAFHTYVWLAWTQLDIFLILVVAVLLSKRHCVMVINIFVKGSFTTFSNILVHIVENIPVWFWKFGKHPWTFLVYCLCFTIAISVHVMNISILFIRESGHCSWSLTSFVLNSRIYQGIKRELY